jgi:hypothetical protein
MFVGSVLCVWTGIFPAWFYRYLPFTATDDPYTADHIISVLQLLLGTGLGFWWGRFKFAEEPTVNLDTDWFYRKPLAHALPVLIQSARQAGLRLEAWGLALLRIIRPYVHNPFLMLRRLTGDPQHRSHSEARAAGTRPDVPYDADRYRLPIGRTILWVLLFFALLALYAWRRQSQV